MIYRETNIKDVFIIEPEPNYDSRGIFTRIYCKKEFGAKNISTNLVQVNHSITLKRGSIRGLHYQKFPQSESKLIKCIAGNVFDVVVDIRKNSKTYLQWISVELSKENMRMIYIPKGCAHGFQTLEDNCEMLYFHSEYYNPEYERRIFYNDNQININWPLKVTEISEKDAEAENFVNEPGEKAD